MLKISNLLNEQAPPPTRTGATGPQKTDATSQGPQPPKKDGAQQTTQPTIFDCVKKVHTNASITSTTLVAKITNTKTYSFFSNNRFLYKDGTKLLKGSWSCDGSDNYSVKLDNGQTYSSKNKVWSAIPTPTTPKTTTTPTTPTTTTTPTTPTTTTTPTPVKAVVIQRGDYNLKVAGSDAIIY